MAVGQLLSISVIFTITKKLRNQYTVFCIFGCLQFVWASIMFFFISEPKIMDEKEAKRQDRKSFCGKIWSLLKLALKACKADIALTIGILAANIMKNSITIQSVTFNEWILSFTPAILTVDEAKTLF